MSININNSECKIIKDDRGVCRTTIVNKEFDENGEEHTEFMNIYVGFKKGIEVKNKERIKITNGFLTFFSFEKAQEDGTVEKVRIPKIMVMEKETIEEGIDEPFVWKSRENKEPEEEVVGTFAWESNDDLPF